MIRAMMCSDAELQPPAAAPPPDTTKAMCSCKPACLLRGYCVETAWRLRGSCVATALLTCIIPVTIQIQFKTVKNLNHCFESYLLSVEQFVSNWKVVTFLRCRD